MKITEEFPSILKFLYDNCHYSLTINVTITDNFIQVPGKFVQKFQRGESMKYDIEKYFFIKCCEYMTNAGYLIKTNNGEGDKDLLLTAKTVELVEGQF